MCHFGQAMALGYSNNDPDMAVKYFVDLINIYHQFTLSRDYPS